LGRIAASLPDGLVLIDFIYYTNQADRKGPRDDPDARYAAFIMSRGTAVRRVDLQVPAKSIDDDIARWRQEIQEESDGLEATGRRLVRLLWAPLAPHVAGASTVLVAPDGDLNYLPWGALPDKEPGSVLLKRYAFGTIISGRQLVGLAGLTRPKDPGMLLTAAEVDYRHAEGGSAPIPLSRVPGASDRSTPVGPQDLDEWYPLPGSREHADLVMGLFRQSYQRETGYNDPECISGPGATKARVRRAMPGKRHFYFYTHGYFAPPEVNSALAPSGPRPNLRPFEGTDPVELAGLYPGLLSGLVWAGAANPTMDPVTGVVDLGSGIMTAEEVAGLNLSECDTAFLAACETGLGRVAGGEGVLGLQRAFHVAGARTVIASQWRVNAKVTQIIASEFYKNLWRERLPKLEALRRAQLHVLEYGPGSSRGPKFWAAWTLSGDPGNLSR
jgi:CHAT domain-containing protein